MLSRILPGLILLAFGLLMLLALIPVGIRAPGYVQPHSLAPQDLPTILAWIVVVTSVAIIVTGALMGEQGTKWLGEISALRATGFCATFAIFLVLLPVIGLSPAVLLFVGTLLVTKSRLKIWQSTLCTVLFTLAVHVIFIEIARIPLPETLPTLF